MDSHRNKQTWHISLRSSVSNIAAEAITAQNIIIAVKCRLMTTLLIIFCMMVFLFLAPIIWYNTNPPSAEAYVTQTTVFHNLEVDSCIVSFYTEVILWAAYVCVRVRVHLPYLYALGYLSRVSFCLVDGSL